MKKLLILAIFILYGCEGKEKHPRKPIVQDTAKTDSVAISSIHVNKDMVLERMTVFIPMDTVPIPVEYNVNGAPVFGSHHCAVIGSSAGMNLTWESYCVIIGEDTFQTNVKGSNFIWSVDYSSWRLKDKPLLVELLRYIESKGLHKITNPQERDIIRWAIWGAWSYYKPSK